MLNSTNSILVATAAAVAAAAPTATATTTTTTNTTVLRLLDFVRDYPGEQVPER